MKTTKQCTNCGKDKDLSEFRQQAGKPMGIRYQCKQCQNEAESNRYIRNRNKRLEQVKANKRLQKLLKEFPDYLQYKVVERDPLTHGKFRLLGECPMCGGDMLLLRDKQAFSAICVECLKSIR